MNKLEEIFQSRRQYVTKAKEKISLTDLEKRAESTQPPVSFLKAIGIKGQVSLIAEFKRSSPSAGVIRKNEDVARIALGYEKGGASAMSVLTEPVWFGGDLEDIRKVKAVSRLPVLRKDFVFDKYQVLEAKVAGASAVLLIADMVSALELATLAAEAQQIGVEPLVEAFSVDAMKAAVDSGATVLGINTRDLKTLEMSPNRVEELMTYIPAGRVVVAESGIKTEADVHRYLKMGVSAMLVGESILKQEDFEGAARRLVVAGRSA